MYKKIVWYIFGMFKLVKISYNQKVNFGTKYVIDFNKNRTEKKIRLILKLNENDYEGNINSPIVEEKMKAFKKFIMLFLLGLLLVPFSGNTAYASSGTISLSDPTAAVGESVSVTVKVTATGSTTIKDINMELAYDDSVLEFEDGTSATGENGTIQLSNNADSSIKTFTLNFKALKNATASIVVSTYDIKDSNDTVIDMSKVGSSTVTISGTDSENTDSLIDENEGTPVQTTMSESDEQQTEDEKIVEPPKKDVEVEIAGTPFYVCHITEDIIPEGFEYIGYRFDGAAVDAVKKDNIILFYLNQIGEEPKIFYVYDDQTDGFSIFAPIKQNLDYYVVSLDENVEIPEGFAETEVSVGGVSVPCWQSDSNSEFYLLYLMNSEGKKNFYLYDIMEKTVQRYYYTSIENTAAETTKSYQTLYTELNDKYNTAIQSRMRIIYVFIVVFVILIFIIINLAFKLSDKRYAMIEDDDEEEAEILYEELETAKNIEITETLDFDSNSEIEADDFEEDVDEEFEIAKKSKRELRKEAKLEKKEKAKQEKEIKNSSKTNDLDDFELHIIDLDDNK